MKQFGLKDGTNLKRKERSLWTEGGEQDSMEEAWLFLSHAE